MSMEQLLSQFDRVIEAPEAIESTREFIVALALRGDLTGSDPVRSAADSVDLDHVLNGMKSLVDTRPRYRWDKSKLSPLPRLEPPKGWLTTGLANTGLFVNGIPFKPGDWKASGRPIIRIQNLSGFNRDYNYTTGEFPVDNVADPGDLLVSWSATLDTWVWEGPQGVVNQHIFKVIPNTNAVIPEFLYWLLKHEVRQLAKSQHAHGLAMMHINRGPFLQHEVLLPPLVEQKQIVEKVRELVALCGQIEVAVADRELIRDALRSASLHRLTANRDRGAIIAEHRAFVNGFPRFLTKVNHVGQMRRAVRDLAVQGRLVQHVPTATSASHLLAVSDQVRNEVSITDRRADSGRQDLLASELRWSVPDTWEWRGLADLVLFVDYRGKTPEKTLSGVRLITAKNIRQGFISVQPEEFISESGFDQWMTRGLPAIGDILFTTEAPMGNAAVVRLPEKFALAQRAIDFRPYGSIDPDFLVLQLLSPPFQDILDKTATGLTAKGIKAAKLKRLPIAVPPMEEQQAIVARVEELMKVCDELEAALSSAQEQRAELLEALLHEVLQGTPGSDEDSGELLAVASD
jgi:type I restriction enzyme S subunit